MLLNRVPSSVVETGLHVVDGQVGIGSQELPEVWFSRKKSEHELDRNARSPYDRLSDHHFRVNRDALQERAILRHNTTLPAFSSIPHRACTDGCLSSPGAQAA